MLKSTNYYEIPVQRVCLYFFITFSIFFNIFVSLLQEGEWLAMQSPSPNPLNSPLAPKRIPFITTFNPSLPHISNIIKKHYNLLLSSNRCKNVFQHLPVVAFRCSPNLHDLLVTAKLPSNSSNPQFPSGSFHCGKNCATCPHISHRLTTYTFFSTGETCAIKSNLTCDTKNLIYMIQCNRCNLQYIGETKRRLKDI